jgi:hypothetical protein
VLNRRHFALASLALGTLCAQRRAWAIGPKTDFAFVELLLGERGKGHGEALARLAWEIEKRTSVTMVPQPRTITLANRDLFDGPFLYFGGDRGFAQPSESELARLRRYLTYGGFLLIDSTDGQLQGEFDTQVRNLTRALFPDSPLETLADDHVVYRTFYLLPRAVGRLAIAPKLEGVTRDGRLVIAYTRNDLQGAYLRNQLSGWELTCQPGGENQREHAIRLGVNLVMYALCLDYKADQVHTEELLRRRRWR